MTPRRCGGSISTMLMVGLVFLVVGALILYVAPFRTLTCTHSDSPAMAACAAVESTDDGVEQTPPGCPKSPVMQCRLEARIIGLIPSHEQSVTGIRDFKLDERKVMEEPDNGRGVAVEKLELTLLLLTPDGFVDLGWHAQHLATRDGYRLLLAFAKNPFSEPVVLTDRRLMPLIIGLLLVGLGLSNLFFVATGRE